MTLGELITELKKEPPEKVCRWGFGHPHSYRGYYDELAFEPCENVTVNQMLADAEQSLGKTFTGYKGGDYEMCEWTEVWIANEGEAGGEVIGPYALAFILGRAKP